MGHPQPPMTAETNNTAENCITNITKKYIQSNRHNILLGTLQKTKKSFPHILGRRKEKPGGLCHKTPSNMSAQKYEAKVFETNKKININIKIPAN